MSKDLPKTLSPADGVDRFERFHSLSAGEYWRALEDIGGNVSAGEVLLVQSIRWVDDQAHTIILSLHPSRQNEDCSRTVRLLIDEFLGAFEFCPEAKQTRQAEIQAIHDRISGIQQEMIETQQNPRLLAAKAEEEFGDTVARPEGTEGGLPALVNPYQEKRLELGAALRSKVTETDVASMKVAASAAARTAELTALWLNSRTKSLADTIKSLTPFFKEQAMMALAQTEDVRRYVSDLYKGIETLDLFVGKGVEVEKLCKGDSAPTGEPVTVYQRKLLVDEELCVFKDLDESFDAASDRDFVDTLQREPAFLEQILPASRSIVVMATTRRFIDYGDLARNLQMDKANRQVFLLIRDGGNVYRVFSPVESHLGAARLFPSAKHVDAIYQRHAGRWTGLDAEHVTFRDVAYTDRLEEHEHAALHYRRFLILLAGLDMRERLLGSFYPATEKRSFVSESFQEAYFRFVHDDGGDRMLPKQAIAPLDAFVKACNKGVRAGARVICYWPHMINSKSCPACYSNSYHYSNPNKLYECEISSSLTIVRRKGGDLYVEAPVADTYNFREEKKRFNAKVFLEKVPGRTAYLCLDGLSPEDLSPYIFDRDVRSHHLEYINLFKSARAFLLNERKREMPAIEAIAQVLATKQSVPAAKALTAVLEAAAAWHCDNPGKALLAEPDTRSQWPTSWTAVYERAKATFADLPLDVFERLAAERGRKPLRLVTDGKGKLRLYVTRAPDDLDDRMVRDNAVSVLLPVLGARGWRVERETFGVMLADPAGERVHYEWDGAASRMSSTRPYFRSTAHKKNTLDFIDRGWEDFAKLSSMKAQSLMDRYAAYRMHITGRSDSVKRPSLGIVIGAVTLSRQRPAGQWWHSSPGDPAGASGTSDNDLFYVSLYLDNPVGYILSLAEDEDHRCRLAHQYAAIYEDKIHHYKKAMDACASYCQGEAWQVGVISPEKCSHAHDGLLAGRPTPIPEMWTRLFVSDDRDPEIDAENPGAMLSLLADRMEHPPLKGPSYLCPDIAGKDEGALNRMIGSSASPDSFQPCHAAKVELFYDDGRETATLLYLGTAAVGRDARLMFAGKRPSNCSVSHYGRKRNAAAAIQLIALDPGCLPVTASHELAALFHPEHLVGLYLLQA